MTDPSFIYDERDRIDSELERQEPPSKHAVAKHTPGPWCIQEHDDPLGPTIAGYNRGSVAYICNMGNETAANARLMAAALVMLKALAHARIALTFYREWMARKEPGTTYPFGVDAEAAACAAIEEATP